jgi:hypothetical protein
MARQYFNVNTQTKLIDTHKQFNGGLKTVDTDDALQDFYLRQAENVSISEFGFLEKRYGLAEKEKLITGTNATGRVQGHHKFKYGTSTDEILAVNGKLYVKEHGQTSFTQVTSFVTISDFSYPTSTTLLQKFTDAEFQTDRDIGMARKGKNVYIFTGTYPLIYTRNHIKTGAALSNGTVYAMPYFIPTWNEVAGVRNGFNLLLGDDYDNLYGFDDLSLIDSNSNFSTTAKPNSSISGIKSQHAPLIPSANYPTEDSSGNTIPQIRLEATASLSLTDEAIKTFVSFDHTASNYVYQTETPQKLGEYYLPYGGTITSGSTTCSVLGSRAVDDNGDYFVCVASTTASSGTNSYYQVVPRTIQYRISGDNAWTDVPESQIQNRTVYSNADNDSDFSQLYGSGLAFENEKGVYQAKFSNTEVTGTGTITNQTISTPLRVDLLGFSVGTFDFRVVWHHERQYESAHTVGTVETFSTFEREYNNITITAEQLNFTSLGYETDAIHTCNQVMERDGRLLVYGSTSMPEFIFFSHNEYYNWFPASYTKKFDTNEDEPIKAISPFMNVLVVQTETKTFGLKGDTPQLAADASNYGTNLYQIFPISPIYGTIAPKSVRPVRNRLYFLSREGIVELTNLAFAEDDKYNVKELDRNIKNVVPRDVEAVAIQHDYQYWINFPSTGETLRYYVDKKAWVKDTYGKDENTTYADNTFEFDGVFKYYSEDGVLSFISNVTQLDTEGVNLADSVYEIVIDKTLPSDFTKAFKSTFETANLNQGYPFHPKKYLENRMDFTLQNEYNTSKDEIPFTTPGPSNGVSTLSFTNKLLKGHSYQLGFDANATITNVQYQLDNGTPQTATYNYIGTLNAGQENEQIVNALYFDVPYKEFDAIYILITHSSTIDFDAAELKDNTYDHTLNFNTFSLSEEGTLNLDNIGYDASEAVVEINLGTVFGANETWVFDDSAFDNRITAVKTVKLSGRGYNYKLFVTDRSKAKWTIENLGITFKFKRARSR